jgi:hypothetical protein
MKPTLYTEQYKHRAALDPDQVDWADDIKDADFPLYYNAFLDPYSTGPLGDPSGSILIQKETPLTPHRRWTYENFHRFHTVITHAPLGDVHFTEYPGVFPWNFKRAKYIRRDDTTLTTRRMAYFGRKHVPYENLPDKWNTTTLYGTRKYLAADLAGEARCVVHSPQDPAKCLPGSIEGESSRAMWAPAQDHKQRIGDWYTGMGSWYEGKMIDIEACQADFIIVLENCIQSHLISEKIHEGIHSDRVVLYLGEPNIENHIPSECYVDLRPHFDKRTRRLDAQALLTITANMSQGEYDDTLHAAREWHSTLDGRWHEERTKMTSELVKRL